MFSSCIVVLSYQPAGRWSNNNMRKVIFQMVSLDSFFEEASKEFDWLVCDDEIEPRADCRG
jgi:hypothetical protein